MNINEIATKAATPFPAIPSKADAFATLQEAIKGDGRPSDYQLAKMYKFFLPGNVKTKTDFDWVALAVSKDTTRPYLHHVFVDDGIMVATDGHRMHHAPTELPDGFYDKAENKIDIYMKFPDYKRIIPARNFGPAKVWKFSMASVADGLRPAYLLDNGSHVNMKYWNAALAGKGECEYYCDGPTDPIRLEIGDRLAVIMPTRA